MSDEDMTCFFCGRGGVRVMVVDEVTDPGCDIANVSIYATSCPHCGARGPMALSEGEAVVAWNRRAGRTCRVGCYPPGYEDNLHYEVCSECGTILTASRPGDSHAARASYCPSCGARVVEEEA